MSPSIATPSVAVEYDEHAHALAPDELHVEWSGDASRPGVVLLHGWGSSAELMRPIAKALSDAFRVANIDLPGHGRSPAPRVAIGIQEHAEFVCRLIDENFDGPTRIIGHSNGGRIGLFIASDDSMKRRVDKLVLIGPSGITPKRSAKFYVRKYLARILKAPFEILPDPMRRFGLDWLRHTLLWTLLGSSDYRRLSGVMRDTFVKTVSTHLDDRVDRIAVPTLIFWGDQDTEISREQVETLELRIPDAGLVVLQGAGHYAYLDDPITVLRATRVFFEDGGLGHKR